MRQRSLDHGTTNPLLLVLLAETYLNLAAASLGGMQGGCCNALLSGSANACTLKQLIINSLRSPAHGKLPCGVQPIVLRSSACRHDIPSYSKQLHLLYLKARPAEGLAITSGHHNKELIRG